uniref:Secreted protein n=1 Tax=Ditylenchus dipsaci TaxID=166011 RepID=A0A915D3D1_9BILA
MSLSRRPIVSGAAWGLLSSSSRFSSSSSSIYLLFLLLTHLKGEEEKVEDHCLSSFPQRLADKPAVWLNRRRMKRKKKTWFKTLVANLQVNSVIPTTTSTAEAHLTFF